MTLWLHAHGGYPSYVDSGATWRRADYDANMLVHCLKGQSFNGYVTLRDVHGTWRRTTAAQPDNAFAIFGAWAAKRLAEIGLKSATLIPVPASAATSFDLDEKGKKLAETVAGHAPGFVAKRALAWKIELQSAKNGGPRDVPTLRANLNVLSLLPREIVLVDDVATTGGHLRACAEELRHRGHTVEHAIVAAQTVWDHPPDMWNIEPRDLEADPLAF